VDSTAETRAQTRDGSRGRSGVWQSVSGHRPLPCQCGSGAISPVLFPLGGWVNQQAKVYLSYAHPLRTVGGVASTLHYALADTA
jgi:hypothetical protein